MSWGQKDTWGSLSHCLRGINCGMWADEYFPQILMANDQDSPEGLKAGTGGVELWDGLGLHAGPWGNRQHWWPPLFGPDPQPLWEPMNSLGTIKKSKRWILLSLIYKGILSKSPYWGDSQLLFWTTKYCVEENTSIIANIRYLWRSPPKILNRGENVLWSSFLGVWAQCAILDVVVNKPFILKVT